MAMQAFMDDSSDENGVYVLAGHIATEGVWAAFSKEWEGMLRFGILNKEGRFHFKMSEMAMNSERMERAGAFFRILENHDIYSVSCKINISELKRAMTRIWALGRSFHWGPYDKPFIVTFRVLMDYLHDRRELFPSLPREEKIDFIFDNQSEKGVIYSVWDDYLRSKSPHSRNLYGSTPRFEDDNDLLPIQAADLWAWWVRKWYKDGSLTNNLDEDESLFVKGVIQSKKRNRAVFISYSEDQLADTFKSMALAMFPNEFVYDTGFSGQVWS
jgi:hypothetical protein